MRSLLIRDGALGDTLLALPALAALGCEVAALGSAAGFLDARIPPRVLRLGDARLGPLYRGGALPDGVLDLLGRPERAYLLSASQAIAASLRASGVEVIQQDPEPPPGVHQALHYLDLARPPEGPPIYKLTGPEQIPPFLDITDADRRAAPIRWSGDPARTPIVLLPGSGGLRKCWPGFAELIGWLRTRAVVVALGPDELERGWSAADFPGARVLEGSDLSALVGLFEQAHLVVGNDAGTTHLAAAVGARVIALFGPTDPARWRPVGPRVQVIRSQPISALTPEAVARACWGYL